MIKLILLAAKNNFSSYLHRPGELLLSTLGSLINNCLYIYGTYVIALLSLPTRISSNMFLITTALITTAWGLINILAGGLLELGRKIETGGLDSFIATPKHPLLVATLSKSDISYLADLLQGIMVIIYLSYKWNIIFAFKMTIGSLITAIALLGVIIIGGSLSFFSNRGNAISALFIQSTVSMSLFPMAAALRGKEKWILYLSPILFTSFLPLQIVQRFGTVSLCLAAVGAMFIFVVSIMLFNFGLKNYRSANFIKLVK